MKLYSRKNHVHKENGRAVKRFDDAKAFQRELEMVTKLHSADVAVPKVIYTADNTIAYEWVDGVTYHTLVERFERKHAAALLGWLEKYYEAIGMLRGDVNFRNFIYCDFENQCYSVDFEDECTAGDKEYDYGRMIAFAVTYEPPFTDSKKHCAKILLSEFLASGADYAKIKQAYESEINAIIERRAGRHYKPETALSFLEGLL